MARTRDNYQVNGNTVDELRTSLNFLLQRIADRLDGIEGIRGSAELEHVKKLYVRDKDDTLIHSME